MTEQAPSPGVSRSSPETRAWDTAKLVATAFGTPPSPQHDPALGDGHAFTLADGQSTLALFPGAVRLTMPRGRIELFRTSEPIVSDEGVVFEQAGAPAASFLSVSPTEAMLHVVFAPSSETAECAERPVAPSDRPNLQPTIHRPSTGAHSPSEGPSHEVVPTTKENEERVKLAGRLGTDPLFRETRNKKLVGQFPLAVQFDENTVKWENIIAHGVRAEKLRDQLKLKRGQFVEVIGYRHQQRRKDRQGREKIVEEIYVTAIIPR